MEQKLVNQKETNEKQDEQLFRLPKNIRQIGQEESRRKIYIEDYVMTMMRQLSRRASMEYQMAVLIGEIRNSGGCEYILINGAIEVKRMELNHENEFSDATWTGIYDQIKNYFQKGEKA